MDGTVSPREAPFLRFSFQMTPLAVEMATG